MTSPGTVAKYLSEGRDTVSREREPEGSNTDGRRDYVPLASRRRCGSGCRVDPVPLILQRRHGGRSPYGSHGSDLQPSVCPFLYRPAGREGDGRSPHSGRRSGAQCSESAALSLRGHSGWDAARAVFEPRQSARAEDPEAAVAALQPSGGAGKSRIQRLLQCRHVDHRLREARGGACRGRLLVRCAKPDAGHSCDWFGNLPGRVRAAVAEMYQLCRLQRGDCVFCAEAGEEIEYHIGNL